MLQHKSQIKVITKQIEQEHIYIYYPQIRLKHKKAQNKINKTILDIILSFIDKEAGHLNDENSLYGEFNVTLNTKNLLSLIIELSYYDENKNSSYNILKSLTINTKDVYIYNFDDLFIKGSNYENVINKAILEYIRDNGVPIVEELANINTNRHFYFTEDSLAIYYNLHKSSLYSANYCIPQFYIPLDYIKDIINSKAIPLEF